MSPEPLKITDGQVGAEEPTEQEIEQARRNWDQMSPEDRDELEQIDREIEQSLYGEISEADYKAFEHPRGRGGKWIETLEHPHTHAILDDTHPAHDLAPKLIGQTMSEIRSGSMSLETAARGGEPMPQDFHYVSGDNRKQVFRSHNQGADLHLTLKPPGFGEAPGGSVADASAELHPPVPHGDPAAALLRGGDPQTVRDQMRAAGYSRPKVVNESGDDWMEFVHPNGQGRALRVDDAPGGVRIGAVTAFRPTDSEVENAKVAAIQENPFAYAKPGGNAMEIANALHNIDSGWQMQVGVGRDELPAGSLPEGVQSTQRFVKQVGSGQPPDSLVLHMRRGGDPSEPEYQRPLEIVNAGHGSMVWDHMIVSPEDHAHEVAIWQEAQDEIKRKREQAMQKDEAIKTALIERDNKALLHELKDMDVYSATQLLQRLGAVKLPQEPDTTPTLSSALVLPDRSTVKLTAEAKDTSALRQAPNVSKVEIKEQDRTRLPYGQAPKNLDELLTDTLGRADEMAQKYKTEANVKHVNTDNIPRNAAGIHRWDGSIGIKQRYLDEISDFLTARAEGKKQSDSERLNFYNNLETLQHEINHGVGVNGGIGHQQYRGIGVNVEEALTEETGHLEVVDWLRSHGMTDVLKTVKQRPNDFRVKGTYLKYRAQVGAILHGAGLTDEERRAKLREMKFQMDTEAQHQELIRLAQTHRPGVKTIRGALIQPGAKLETGMDFQPVVRPDLSDIDAEPLHVTAADGQKYGLGDPIKFALLGSGRMLEGRIADVNEKGEALVVLRDGGRLWVSGDKINQSSEPTPRPVTAEAPRVRSAEHHHAMTVAGRWMQGQNIPAEQIDGIHRDVSNALGVVKISPAQAYLARLRDAASLGPLAGKGINVSDLDRTFKTEGLA